MATIRKIEGKRGVRYRAVVRKTGRPETSQTFRTKKLAEAWARAQEQAVDEGRALPNAIARRMTLRAVIDAHMARDRDSRDPTKVSRLGWWADELGDRKLADIGRAAIAESMDKLADGGRAPATVNRYLASLSAALRDAVEREWIAENPARKVRRPREDNARHRYLSDEERPALLAACQAPESPDWLYPFVVTALGTGARKGELLALRWADVDLERGRALLVTTKTGKPRMLVLLPPVVAALRAWGKVRRLGEERVFPIGEFKLYDFWKPACDRAGIEGLWFHDLRHSCASYMAQAGANLPTIMTALGHTTLAATQRYQHLLVDHVADAMADALAGKLS